MFINKKISLSPTTIFLIIIGVVLILIAGFRPIGIDHDSLNYISILHVSLSEANFIDKEPSFWIINEINKFLFSGNVQTFFLIYAILGVTIKIIAIRRLSSSPPLSIYLYICLYFILLEMTQIRAGVATGIFLLAIPDIYNRNFKNYFLKTAIAMTFHYSAVIMLFLYFINSEKINKKIYYLLPILGLILSLVPTIMIDIFNLLSFIFPAFISNKITIHLMHMDNGHNNKINIFNIFILSLTAFYYFFLFNLDKVKSRLNILLIKLLAIQIFIFYAFSSIPVFAFRLSEFIGISMIIIIPNLILMFKHKLLPIFIILVWGGGYLWFIGVNRLINF